MGDLELAGTWYREACDDGNALGGDGCSASCLLMESGWRCEESGGACTPICGDGQLLGGESCDPGLRLPDGYCFECRTIVEGRCGDGAILSPFEHCDDGNAENRDGCSSECVIETGYSCAGQPSLCVASGVARDSILVYLNAADRVAFCEWLVRSFGGQGHATSCLNSGVATYTLQVVDSSTCVAELEHGTIRRCGSNSCTVGGIEDEVAAGNGDLCGYWPVVRDNCTWVYQLIGHCEPRVSSGDLACRACT